ncbi:MAG: chorismate mutase [Candidatus Bathycorpusculaceae bacterium]
MDKIALLRKKIDEVDEKILFLLKERDEISQKIGKIKLEKGIPIRDSQREGEKYRYIMERVTELGLNPKAVRNIYRNIIAMSIHSQEKGEPTNSRNDS